MLDFSFLRKYYGGWWYGCAEFEVFPECGASVKFPDAGFSECLRPLWS